VLLVLMRQGMIQRQAVSPLLFVQPPPNTAAAAAVLLVVVQLQMLVKNGKGGCLARFKGTFCPSSCQEARCFLFAGKILIPPN
jgi:hypothetical protein